MATILVIDDESRIRKAIKRYLMAKGHTVITAENGNAGLEKVQEERPSMVLLDVNMPGKDGVTVLKEIKELHPDLPVVMVTGVAEDEVGRGALNLGALEYIPKPVDFGYLEKVLEIALRLSLEGSDGTVAADPAPL